MKSFFTGIGQDLKAIWKEGDKNAFKGIIFTALILVIYCYFGTFSFFQKCFPDLAKLDYWSVIYHNFSALILFFGLGLFFVKFILKGSLKDFGLCKGDYKLGIKLCLIIIPIFILSGLSCVLDSDMNVTYPLARQVIDAPIEFVLLYYFSYLCYYIGWEFLFRGIGIFSIEKKSGALTAIAVTTLISALIHTSIASFGKPFAETASAVIAGLVFGFAAYKTKSIWYGLFMHMAVGFSTDIFITVFTQAGLI